MVSCSTSVTSFCDAQRKGQLFRTALSSACLIFIYTPSSRGVEVSPYADIQPSAGFLRQLSPLEATGFALAKPDPDYEGREAHNQATFAGLLTREYKALLTMPTVGLTGPKSLFRAQMHRQGGAFQGISRSTQNNCRSTTRRSQPLVAFKGLWDLRTIACRMRPLGT